jgi:hypothetical protein
MATRHLRDIDIEEISLVSKGANKRRFMIIKSQGGANSMEDILKDFLVNFSEDEDVEDFQKAENEDKLREKLRESLKEIRKFEEDLPDSLRKAISVLALWAYKGYGYPAAGKKPVKKKDDPFYWKSFDTGNGKEEIEKIKKRRSGGGDKFPSITRQLFGDPEDDED